MRQKRGKSAAEAKFREHKVRAAGEFLKLFTSFAHPFPYTNSVLQCNMLQKLSHISHENSSDLWDFFSQPKEKFPSVQI